MVTTGGVHNDSDACLRFFFCHDMCAVSEDSRCASAHPVAHHPVDSDDACFVQPTALAGKAG